MSSAPRVNVGNVGAPDCMNRWGAGFGGGLSRRFTATAVSTAATKRPCRGGIFVRIRVQELI
jgi:hypothetical protein